MNSFWILLAAAPSAQLGRRGGCAGVVVGDYGPSDFPPPVEKLLCARVGNSGEQLAIGKGLVH